MLIMLDRISAAATAIALLAHSLLGCCWHHAHADGCEPASACHAAAHHEHHHADRPESAGPRHDEDDPDHRHPTLCVEPTCSFVGAAAPQLIDMPLISFGELPSDAAECSAAGTRDTAFAAGTKREPLSTARMRAVLQSWVV
jgi:hypothetical protein